MASDPALDVIDELDAAQRERLTELFQDEWWTAGREPEDVERMLAGTTVTLGLVERDSRRLVAFARALTDGVYKALVLDVVVEPELRGAGLGDRLMRALAEHPALRDVAHLELYCLPGLAPFYERYGFTRDLGELGLMRWER